MSEPDTAASGAAIRIVFAADSHLNRRYARMTPDQLADRRDRLRAAWKRTVDYAVSEKAHLYIHGGDLFDGPNPRASELVWAATQFRRLADAGVDAVLIGGNHDVPRTRHHGATPQRLFEEVRLAHVFTDPTRVTWHVAESNGMRVAVGGVPHDPHLGAGDDPLDRLAAPVEPPASDAAILVTHYAVEGLAPPLSEEPTIRRTSIASLAGRVDFVLAGHLHAGWVGSVEGVRVLYLGPTERMTFGEVDARPGFAVLEVRAGPRPSIQARIIGLEPQPMRRECVAATEIPAGSPTEWLLRRLERVSSSDQLLQLRIEGALDRAAYQAIRFVDVWRLGAESNAYFDLDRRRLTVSAPSPVLAAGAGGVVSPRAEISRVALEMRARASDDRTRALIDEARARVTERYGAGRIEEGE